MSMVEILYILIFCVCFLLNFFKLLKKYNFFEVLIHPIIFLTAYFVLFFLLPGYSETFYVPLLFRGKYFFTKEEIFFLVRLVVITYIVITLYFFFRPEKRNKWKEKESDAVIKKNKNRSRKTLSLLEGYIILYYFFIFFVLVVLIEKFGGIVNIFNNYPSFIMKSRQGSSFLLYAIYSVEVIPAVYLMFSKRVNPLFFTLILIWSIGLVSFTGARTLILTILIQNYFVMLLKKFLNFKLFLTFLFFFVAFFSLVSWIRSTYSLSEINSFDQSFINLKNFWIRNMDQFVNSLITIKKIKEGEISLQKGRTMIDCIYFFIPSHLYPQKPLSYYPSRLIYEEAASKTGQTFNFGMIGRSYLEFGTFGVIISNFLLFIVFLKIYERLIRLKYKSLNFSFKTLVLVYIYSHTPQVYILGIFSHIISYLLLFILLFALLFFGYKIFCSFINRAISKSSIVWIKRNLHSRE